jgi:hypothetical protein
MHAKYTTGYTYKKEKGKKALRVANRVYGLLCGKGGGKSKRRGSLGRPLSG